MKQAPKTIQIFLPNGDPQGMRIAEITTRIVQVIEVPRSLLADFSQMPESGQVALYFLFGESDDADPQVYIGQTGNLKARLAAHNREKDFWQRALIVISKTNSLTQTHGLFLEWQCLNACRKTGRYSDLNGNEGNNPHTPAPLKADCLEIFETAKTLLATLGYPVFDSLNAAEAASDQEKTFYCRGSEADGRGIYTSEGFVVFKGSSGRTEMTASIGLHRKEARTRLVNCEVLKEIDGRYVFQKDYLFNSPSAAATGLMGRSANGWVEWKDESGKTLDEVVRQQDET